MYLNHLFFSFSSEISSFCLKIDQNWLKIGQKWLKISQNWWKWVKIVENLHCVITFCRCTLKSTTFSTNPNQFEVQLVEVQQSKCDTQRYNFSRMCIKPMIWPLLSNNSIYARIVFTFLRSFATSNEDFLEHRFNFLYFYN